jgi:hypothetical protein
VELTIRRQLCETEARIERLIAELRRVEGLRDKLLLKLVDSEGAHDRRFAGPR